MSEGAAEVEESPRRSEKHKNVGENTKMLYKHNKIVLYCGQQKEKGLKGWLKRTRTG